MGVLLIAKFIHIHKSDAETSPENEWLMDTLRAGDEDAANENHTTASKHPDEKAVDKIRNSKIFAAFRTKECLYVGFLYGMFSITEYGFLEMFPVFAATSRKYEGLAFTTRDLGLVLLLISIFQIFVQVLLLPKLLKKFGSKRALVGSNIVLAFIIPLLPLAGKLKNKYLLWGFFTCHVFIFRVCAFLSICAISVLINNSVPSNLLGTANGVGRLFSSVGRLMGPLVFGSLFSWSLKNIKGVSENIDPLGFPFNQYLTFILLGFWCLLIATLSAFFVADTEQEEQEVILEEQK